MPNSAWVVTGAAGFIGARFVEDANRRGEPVISVDERRSVDTFVTRPEHATLDFGTKLDIEELEGFLAGQSREQVRGIVHLGACSDTMELDERVHARLNYDFSRMLWSWCARAGVPLVYASSAATYGGGEYGYDDDERALEALTPLNPYGASKHRFDLWALAQERSAVTPPKWAGFKFFNVYGFGERHKGRMASVVMHGYDQILKTGLVKLFKSHKAGIADGDQRRDFVYVEDVVDVLRFAAEGNIARGVYNLGTGQARSFEDLARATFAGLGREPRIEFIDMPEALRERYQYFTQAEMARLRAAGYARPFTSLEDGVARYVQRLVRQDEAQ